MGVSDSLNAEPYWFRTTLPIFPEFKSDLEVDVVIVGGGLTGLTAGYLKKTALRPEDIASSEGGIVTLRHKKIATEALSKQTKIAPKRKLATIHDQQSQT